MLPGAPLLLRWTCCGLAVLLLLSGACSQPEARQRVLTFFFTGVPPLGGEEDLDGAGEDGVLVAVVKGPGLPRRWEQGAYVHGPFGARECGSCHEMVPETDPAIKPTRIVPGRFVFPATELCISCHEEKAAERALAQGLWRHGPTENCQRCHHPHTSREPFYLRQAAGNLCRSCHAEGFIHNREQHEGEDDCLACHNPHLGANAMMLREDFEESF